MKAKQLTIFQRQHCNGVPCDSYILAAWHWKWSLTWRWILSWSKWYAPPGRQGFTFMRIHLGRGFNFTTGLNLPLIGHFRLQTQPNMPLRPKCTHPLDGLHINQGSLDVAADAYEAEYNKAHGIETPNVKVSGLAPSQEVPK